MSGQNVDIRKISEAKNLNAANVSGISADGAHIVIEVPSSNRGADNQRRTFNSPRQLKLKLVDIFNTLPKKAAGAAATGEVYVDATTGVVTIKP